MAREMNQDNDKEKNEMERKPVKKTAVVQCLGVIDEEICISCGMCATHCPIGTMKDADGMFH